MKKINKNKQRGGFILELMIGLFMSAIAVLSVMFVYTNFESQKRTTTQLSQTISGTALAFYPLQKNIKMAGFGFNKQVIESGCLNVLAYDSTKTPSDYSFSDFYIPLNIIPGANDKTSDQLIISYGTSYSAIGSINKVKLKEDNDGGNANYKVYDSSSLATNDIVLSYDSSNMGTCALAQITNITGGGEVVIHNSGGSIYNKPGGLGVPLLKDSSYLIKLNTNIIPKKMYFQITNNQLTQTDYISDNGNTKVIGDNIVLMKAMAGVDLDLNGSISETEWKNSLVSSDYQKIRGVKLAILARSPLKEKPDSSTNSCVITTNKDFFWDNGTTGGGNMDISDLPDWKCYRYRLLETTVPIKSLIWTN